MIFGLNNLEIQNLVDFDYSLFYWYLKKIKFGL